MALQQNLIDTHNRFAIIHQLDFEKNNFKNKLSAWNNVHVHVPCTSLFVFVELITLLTFNGTSSSLLLNLLCSTFSFCFTSSLFLVHNVEFTLVVFCQKFREINALKFYELISYYTENWFHEIGEFVYFPDCETLRRRQ